MCSKGNPEWFEYALVVAAFAVAFIMGWCGS